VGNLSFAVCFYGYRDLCLFVTYSCLELRAQVGCCFVTIYSYYTVATLGKMRLLSDFEGGSVCCKNVLVSTCMDDFDDFVAARDFASPLDIFKCWNPM